MKQISSILEASTRGRRKAYNRSTVYKMEESLSESLDSRYDNKIKSEQPYMWLDLEITKTWVGARYV